MQRQMVGFLRKRSEVGVVLIAILLVIGFTATTEGVWLSQASISEVLRVTAILGIIALGEALVITTGEIDISVGSIFGIVGITFLGLIGPLGIAPAIVAALILALVIGAFNGFIVAYFRIPSLIVTLGSLFIFRGLAFAVFENRASFSAGSDIRANAIYRFFGDGEILGFNNAILWAIIVLLILTYLLFWTPTGNRILAVGGDEKSALSRGVSTATTKWGVFVAAAFLAGLAGVLEASNLAFVDGSFGRYRELQAIAAAVLGGCALAGGRSSLVGTLLGAFILSGIQSYLIIRAIQPQWFILLLGLIVVLVSLADRGLSNFLTKMAASYKEGPAEQDPVPSISGELGGQL